MVGEERCKKESYMRPAYRADTIGSLLRPPELLQARAAAPFKVALPAVSQIVSSYWQREVSAPAYARISDLYPEIAESVRREIAALLAEGVPYIQIDAPRYTYFVDERWRQRFRDQGTDPDALLDEWTAADNTSLVGIKSRP